MSLPYAAIEHLNLNTADIHDPYLRRMQAAWDEIQFDETPYALELKGVNHLNAKAAHIAWHVAKLAPKLFDSIHGERDCANSDVVVNEILPDCLMYRTQLANTFRYNLHARLDTIVPSDSLEEVTADLMAAQRVLTNFAEPLDHESVNPRKRRLAKEIGIPALHHAGISLALITGQDPHEAHANRLAYHLSHHSGR
jgi:hypothetical protein